MNKKKITIIISIIILLISIAIYLIYSPLKSYIITSSMTSMNHKYIATSLYSNNTIYKVLSKNKIIENNTTTNPNLISINGKSIIKDKYDKEILKRKKDTLYKVIKIKEDTYNGYLVAIYNPKRIFLETAKDLGKEGEYITSVSERDKASVVINGGGFYDPNWEGNGAIPHGIVIKDSRLVTSYEMASSIGGLVGFNNDDKLVLSKSKNYEKFNYRDALEFGPFLIVNGKSSKIVGNGGYGLAPRTAIAQRQDGIVLLLVINGRIPSSIGASMKDLIKIFERYKAYNAVNMDGGSSTALVINNKVINKPVGGSKNGLRKLPTFWVVK